jgi:hypothetical protein
MLAASHKIEFSGIPAGTGPNRHHHRHAKAAVSGPMAAIFTLG